MMFWSLDVYDRYVRGKKNRELCNTKTTDDFRSCLMSAVNLEYTLCGLNFQLSLCQSRLQTSSCREIRNCIVFSFISNQ